MAGWASRWGMVAVACGVLGGCGVPLEGEELETSSEALASASWEEAVSPQALCLPDAASTQRMKADLPPSEGVPSRLIVAPYSLVNFQGRLYFIVLGNDAGRTLWRSNGTPAGTVAVKALEGLHSLTPTSSFLFFRAEDAAHGDEPWVSDGTSAGTRLLKDLTPGAEGSFLVDMTALGEQLVFFRQVTDPTTSAPRSELWTSDGTAAGTVRVKSSLPEVIPSSGRRFNAAPAEVLKLGGTLLFLTQEENGPALWRTDGTKAGTTRLRNVGAAGTGVFSTLVSGGRAFFYVNGANGTTAVWTSDGTQGGTRRLYTYDATLSPLMLRVLGSSLYVTTTSATTQRITLRRIPLAGGSEAPVFTLPNAYANEESAYPYVTGVSAVDGGTKVYFALTISGERQAPRDAQLWVTDGTAAGTRMLHQPLSRSDEYTSPVYAAADNLVFFTADTPGTTGIEPWVSNGTPAGTRLLKDMLPGRDSSYAYEFLRVGSRVFMSTAEHVDGGQVWATKLSNTCSSSAAP